MDTSPSSAEDHPPIDAMEMSVLPLKNGCQQSVSEQHPNVDSSELVRLVVPDGSSTATNDSQGRHVHADDSDEL